MGVTSAIVFERDLIVVVQAAKNIAPGVAFPICSVTAHLCRSMGKDGAKLRILFLFLLLKQKKITNCLEYCREMPIFAT